MERRRIIAVTVALMLPGTAGCRLLQSGPSDQEVTAAVEKSPPSPPTAGPTYLAELTSVRIEERGPYNSDGKYWPVHVRVKGDVKIRLTNAFQLGVIGDRANEKPEPLEFAEEARLMKDDFGSWRVAYNYDLRGPKWRLAEPGAARAAAQ